MSSCFVIRGHIEKELWTDHTIVSRTGKIVSYSYCFCQIALFVVEVPKEILKDIANIKDCLEKKGKARFEGYTSCAPKESKSESDGHRSSIDHSITLFGRMICS